jgi:phenylalanine-4-hydroxylase
MREATQFIGDSFRKNGRERAMKRNTHLPSGIGPKNRFRDARRNPDFTIDQDWASYSAAEHDRWDRLFRRSLAAVQNRACDEFLAMMKALSRRHS